MSRDPLDPDGLVHARSTVDNHGVVDDGTLYVSGQVGWNEEFEVAGGDMVTQTSKAFENAEVLDAVDRASGT